MRSGRSIRCCWWEGQSCWEGIYSGDVGVKVDSKEWVVELAKVAADITVLGDAIDRSTAKVVWAGGRADSA